MNREQDIPCEEKVMDREVQSYEEAAAVIALWLSEFCDLTLPYPAMIADASRRAAKEIEILHREYAARCAKSVDTPE